MIPSQQVVIGWIEFAVAGTIMLAATKFIVDRLRQPVDRVNLIAMSLIVSALMPLLLCFMSVPRLQLGLVANYGEPVWIAPTSSEPRHPLPPETASSSIDGTEQPSPFDTRLENQEAVHDQTQEIIPQTIHSSTTSISLGIPTPIAASAASSRFSNWAIATVILLLCYGFATAWFCLQWIIGTVRLRNISCKASVPERSLLNTWDQVANGLGRKVTLLVTTEIAAPLVYGWRRPVVLIPEQIAMGDQSALKFCLAHEWSHVSGGDLPRWQLTNLLQLVFWYQPLFWMLRRELRICQDLVADNRAVDAHDHELGRIEYSELLVSMAKQTKLARIGGAMAFYDRSSQLSRRIELLLTGGQSLRSRSTHVFCGLSGFLLLISALVLGSVRLSTAHAQEPAPVKTAETQTAAANQTSNNEKPVANNGEMKVVRGRVVNQSGEPVAGAKLWLPLQFEPRRTVEATADKAGNFEFECPTKWISPRFQGSSWTVWTYAPGYSIQSQSVWEVIRGQSDREQRIELPPENTTRFKVSDPQGKPLANVLVKPQNYKTSVGYELIPLETHTILSARTDDKGMVTLPAIHAGPLFSLEMVREDFGRQTIRVDWNTNFPEREIHLRATASIKGQLVAETPEWVRGVKLGFTTDNRDEGKDAQGIAEVVTDDKGHFEVPVIASGGPLRMYVRLDPELPVRPRFSDDIYLTIGETMQLEIPLVAAPLVSGKVISKSTGKPVANAEISLGYGGFRQNDYVSTDENGQYEGRALPGGVRVHIISLPSGLVQLGAPWAEPYQVPKDVEKFQLPTIEVVGTHEIIGQLIDSNDQPLPNMQVLAVDGNRRYGFSKSDKEGRFKMSVPDGVETATEVFIDQLGSIPVQVIQREPLIVRYAADVRQKEIEAGRAEKSDVTLTGRMLFAGKPIAGVPVQLNRGTTVSIGSSGQSGTQYRPAGETKTDASGNFRLSGLKAGDTYQIEFKPPFPAADPNWHHQSPYIQTLPVDAKGEVALPDIKLLKLAQTIAGVIVDPDGKPVQGATVSVQLRTGASLSRLTSSGPPPWAVSDHQGRFHLKELPDEPLSIMAYFANPKGGRIRFPAKLNVEKNQQDIRIVLDPSLREEEGQ